MLDTTGWHPRIQRLYQHWLDIHPPTGLPGRQHFDPIAIPELLSGLWLVDVERAPFRLRYRLVGTVIVAAIGRDVTGMALDEAHPHLRDHPTALPRFKAVVDTKMPSRRRGKPLFWTHHDYREIENVVLPFARDGRTVDLLMIHSVLYEA